MKLNRLLHEDEWFCKCWNLRMEVKCNNNVEWIQQLASWCFEPSQPLGVASGLILQKEDGTWSLSMSSNVSWCSYPVSNTFLQINWHHIHGVCHGDWLTFFFFLKLVGTVPWSLKSDLSFLEQPPSHPPPKKLSRRYLLLCWVFSKNNCLLNQLQCKTLSPNKLIQACVHSKKYM